MAQGTGGNWNRDREKEVLRLKMELDSIKSRKAILETFSWKSYYYLLYRVCDKNVGRLDKWFCLSYNLNAY